ncbi:hypothetical protein [Chromohalobacter israelensis]|uniref:hypothetical protein n=1 Tax=Chromohalobacter israelensis TaxID=141390 RepID=UPI0012EC1606|nr:hypothetical protein [Chromohalobacter israelensis]MDF9434613.1 hypothetical protein [Chromohalobacter israelensis]
MSVFVTIVTGVSVFVIGQLVMRMIIDPATDLKKEMGSITNTFLERAGGENMVSCDAETSTVLKKHAAKLMQGLWTIPWYNRTRHVFGLPGSESVIQSARDLNTIAKSIDDLIEMSNSGKVNSMSREDSHNIAKTIGDAMRSLSENLGALVFLSTVTRFLDEDSAAKDSSEAPPSK